jgi:hypothetical protein
MPCGCKKGRWNPAAEAAAPSAPVKAKGPHAPGYSAPDINAPKPTAQATK